MRILGLDVGEKRIGIARADSDTRIAVPVGTILVDGSEWLQIARIARVQSVQFFVIGLPRNNEGGETAQSLYVRKFARTLMEKIPGARVRFQDESLTSVLAEERLKKKRAKEGRKFDKGEIDTEAATIILQDFLESLKGARPELPKNTASTGSGGASYRGETKAAKGNAVLAKEEDAKAKEAEKRTKHKMKTMTKIMTGVGVLVVLGLIGTGVAMMFRDKVRAEREEEYRRQEAAMTAEVFNFTIRPGETIFQIREHLLEAGYSASEADEALGAQYDFEFLKERPAGASLEGYLYGETHEFYKSASAKEVLEKFLKGTEEVLTEYNLKERFAQQGLTLYEGVTLASIIQKEARGGDLAGVARVFLNRMNYGMPLGSDVTVSYALDIIDPARETYTDNSSALTVDSCYNTRLYKGLPCGPISNPGLDALLAVAEPSDNDYLFFLTGDDGLMYYSYTDEEHIRNSYEHCQELCNVAL